MKQTKLSSKLLLLLVLLSSALFFVACSDDDDDNPVQPENSITQYKTPKYVFFFIGDGMSSAQINLTEAALADSEFKLSKTTLNGLGALNLTGFPVTGMSTTMAADRYITGSAASATALATGSKTAIGVISKTTDKTKNIKTMAEIAKEKGMRVGIVSSVSIDHATPACFYAHADSRGQYYDIAAQMATSNFDYFGGGYAKGNFPSKGNGDIISKMQSAGYQVVTTRGELNSAQNGKKLWAYNHTTDGSAALYYDMDRPEDHISLEEFTQRGIDVLDNEKGFFLMVEAGKVDWACHANDAVAATHDMVAFDKSIKKAIDFYHSHPDETLIVVTGDHECGGLTLGFASTKYETAFNLLKYQKVSYEVFTAKVYEWKQAGNVNFDGAVDSVKKYFGLGNAALNEKLALSDYEMNSLENAFKKTFNNEDVYPSEVDYLSFGGYDAFTVTVTHLLNNKAGLDWTSYKHTGVPVPVFAMGQGQYEFSGYYDNTDIAKKIMKIAKLQN